ncbi:hypothetical protein NDA11_006121 [Ustilago hordei]|nr:hypothetical protein NDA11_006121 [Ustilago hordei]KAJ1590243.1 hypothetical protein NDA12_005485 [Ustilago hordei]
MGAGARDPVELTKQIGTSWCSGFAAHYVRIGYPIPDPVTHQTSIFACCHGPGCSRSRRVTGSYGRSTGIEDLVDTSREHGRSAVSMETMDSYGFTCKGALSPYARRTRHSHEEDQAQRAGAATRRTKLRWLPLRGSRDRKSTQVMRRRSSVEGVDTTQEAQGCQAGEAPEQYSMKKVLSGERAGAASLAML